MNTLLLIFIGFSVGSAIALAIAAFIVSVGAVTKMAVITGTEKFTNIYEMTILAGIMAGTIPIIFDFEFHINPIWLNIPGLFSGMFIGIVAISLVEIINVFPIMKQRTRLTKGLKYLIIAIALGKMIGSIIYWTIDGFVK